MRLVLHCAKHKKTGIAFGGLFMLDPGLRRDDKRVHLLIGIGIRGSKMEFKCPRCEKKIPYQSFPEKNAPKQDLPEFFPFCSERCKFIDLGTWMEEGYRIPVREEEQTD